MRGLYATLLGALILHGAPSDPAESTRDADRKGAGSLQLGFLFEDYFGRDVAELERHALWISEYDLAVALLLEREAPIDVTLEEIVRWRREGSSWDAITRRCQLGAELYYIDLPMEMQLPEPYARAWRVWRGQPGADQRLEDEVIRELVLLRTLVATCALEPAAIIALRSAGQSPRAIAAAHPLRPDAEYTAPPVPDVPGRR